MRNSRRGSKNGTRNRTHSGSQTYGAFTFWAIAPLYPRASGSWSCVSCHAPSTWPVRPSTIACATSVRFSSEPVKKLTCQPVPRSKTIGYIRGSPRARPGSRPPVVRGRDRLPRGEVEPGGSARQRRRALERRWKLATEGRLRSRSPRLRMPAPGAARASASAHRIAISKSGGAQRRPPPDSRASSSSKRSTAWSVGSGSTLTPRSRQRLDDSALWLQPLAYPQPRISRSRELIEHVVEVLDRQASGRRAATSLRAPGPGGR